MAASDNVQALEQFLAQNVGVGQVTVDGTTVRYERSQALEELKYWRRQEAREAGRRRRATRIDLGGF